MIKKLFVSIFVCCVAQSCFIAAPVLGEKGGTLVWGTTNPPVSMNPVLTRQGVSTALFELIFNSLIRLDGKKQIIPDLAMSWDVSADGLTYTFHLREGVHFHDGVEFTADDVKFTYDAIADPGNASPLKDVAGVEGQWRIVDRYTVQFILEKPDDIVLYRLIRGIVPKHLLDGKDLRQAPFNSHPVGTGPFLFDRWNKETGEVALKANPDYYEGRPGLDGVVVKVYSDNTRLWAGLMRREVDFVKYLNQEDYLILQKDPTFLTYEVPEGITCAIVYDLADALLADLNVRKAVAWGLDVKKILKETATSGIQSSGPFESHAFEFGRDVNVFEYDPESARSALAASGWRDINSDGILEKEGQALEVRMLVDSRSEYFQRIAMMIRQQLSEIGLKVVVLSYQNEKELTAEFLARHKPQARLRFFGSFSFSAEVSLRKWYPSAGPLGSLWHYSSSRVDALIAQAGLVSDKGKAWEVYRKIQEVMYDDQPACFLFSPMTLHAVAAKFQGTETFFLPSMPNYMIKNWYLKQ